MSRANDAVLAELHGMVAKFLSERIASGEASGTDFSNAIKFLKDNNITGLVEDENELGELARALSRKAKVPGMDRSDELDAISNLEFNDSRMN